MIGPLEIAIVAVIILLFIGYRKLPQLGRSAGTGLRKVKETASEKVGSGDEISTSIGRSAGRGMRDIRELRESLSTKPRETEPSPRRASEEPRRESEPAAESRPEADRPSGAAGERES